MDSGILGSSFTLVSGYDGTSSTYTITNAAESIVSGKIYTFITVASNIVGDSEAS